MDTNDIAQTEDAAPQKPKRAAAAGKDAAGAGKKRAGKRKAGAGAGKKAAGEGKKAAGKKGAGAGKRKAKADKNPADANQDSAEAGKRKRAGKAKTKAKRQGASKRQGGSKRKQSKENLLTLVPGGKASHGFLHVGKTGGSSLASLIKQAQAKGYSVPALFGHRATTRAIFRKNPDIKLSVTLRDPIERIISGFNSRLRQGRPTYDNAWSTEEAVAFLRFPDVGSFLAARISTDEHLLSSAVFAEKAISHVRRGYRYHFHSADFVRQHRENFYFLGDMEGLSASAYRYVEPGGVPKEFCDGIIETRHSAGGSTEQSLAALGPDAIKRLKEIYAKEYEIYEALKEIAGALPTKQAAAA